MRSAIGLIIGAVLLSIAAGAIFMALNLTAVWFLNEKMDLSEVYAWGIVLLWNIVGGSVSVRSSS